MSAEVERKLLVRVLREAAKRLEDESVVDAIALQNFRHFARGLVCYIEQVAADAFDIEETAAA